MPTVEPLPTQDLRIFDVSTKFLDYCLTESDFQKFGLDYKTPVMEQIENEGEYTNSEFLSDPSDTELLIVNKLQRVTGWYKKYWVQDGDTQTPMLNCNITVFETEEGARQYVDEYNNLLIEYSSLWEEVDKNLDLGDTNKVVVRKKDVSPLWVFTSIKNVVITIWETNGDLNLAEDVTRIVLKNLEDAPLKEASIPAEVTIGEWVNTNDSACQNLKINKSGPTYELFISCNDGSSMSKPLIMELVEGEERLIENPGNLYGDYMVIEADGSLAFYDKEGLIYKLPSQ
jgi:hypothetical protein